MPEDKHSLEEWEEQQRQKEQQAKAAAAPPVSAPPAAEAAPQVPQQEEAPKRTRLNAYEELGKIIQMYEAQKPSADPAKEERLKRTTRLHTIAEGLRTLSEGAGLAAFGAPVERRGENRNVLKSVDDYNRYLEGMDAKEREHNMLITKLKAGQIESDLARQDKEDLYQRNKQDREYELEANRKHQLALENERQKGVAARLNHAASEGEKNRANRIVVKATKAGGGNPATPRKILWNMNGMSGVDELQPHEEDYILGMIPTIPNVPEHIKMAVMGAQMPDGSRKDIDEQTKRIILRNYYSMYKPMLDELRKSGGAPTPAGKPLTPQQQAAARTQDQLKATFGVERGVDALRDDLLGQSSKHAEAPKPKPLVWDNNKAATYTEEDMAKFRQVYPVTVSAEAIELASEVAPDMVRQLDKAYMLWISEPNEAKRERRKELYYKVEKVFLEELEKIRK